MPHAKIGDLAKGFLNKSAKKVEEATRQLVNNGKNAAIDYVCAELEVSTLLPHSVCRSAANRVVAQLSKDVRKRLKR